MGEDGPTNQSEKEKPVRAEVSCSRASIEPSQLARARAQEEDDGVRETLASGRGQCGRAVRTPADAHAHVGIQREGGRMNRHTHTYCKARALRWRATFA